MSATATAREAIWRSESHGWSLALNALGCAVAAPWMALGVFLVTISFSSHASPYASIQGGQTTADLPAMGLVAIAVLVFALVLVALPCATAWRARRLRVAVAVWAASAALSTMLAITLVLALATSATPFLQLHG